MKKSFSIRALFCACLLIALGTLNSNAAFKNWTNTLGGNWFDPFGWSPGGVPLVNDVVTITNSGTYTVYIPTGMVATATITIGGGSGKQTLIYGSAFTKLALTNSTVLANGVLMVTNQGMYGALTVKTGGELQMSAGGNMQLYNFALTNAGTTTCSNGSLSVGGSNGEVTYFTNSGLFQFNDNASTGYGGGGRCLIINAGTIRKLIGAGTATIGGMDLINLPSGLVDVLSGTLQLNAFQTNILGGSFTATSTSFIKFNGGQTDAGGVASGAGSFQFISGTFYLRTNTIPNLKFITGDVYVTGTTSFQQAGAITNLTLDGANLRGTNRIAGTVTVNSGNLLDTITIQPTGQLLLPAVGGTQLYACNLINQGSVLWGGAALSVGNTSISNGGNWTITGNAAMNYGGVGFATFTNAGTVQKTSGAGPSSLAGNTFVNLPSGLVSVSSGSLQMPFNYTNAGGELRLSGGTLTGSGVLGMTAGLLDGFGSIGVAASIDGGTVQPGGVSSGNIQFASSLTLGAGCTLLMDGTGTAPGSYDQLSVAGSITNNNSTLQIAGWPVVPVGTAFVIITNTSASLTVGTFNGLSENTHFTFLGQPYRMHYSGGNGNDVVMVRDSATGIGPLLSITGFSNTVYRFIGAGESSTIYTIQASTNLLQWTNIGYSTGDISGHFNFTDTNAALFRYRMYRTTN